MFIFTMMMIFMVLILSGNAFLLSLIGSALFSIVILIYPGTGLLIVDCVILFILTAIFFHLFKKVERSMLKYIEEYEKNNNDDDE